MRHFRGVVEGIWEWGASGRNGGGETDLGNAAMPCGVEMWLPVGTSNHLREVGFWCVIGLA